jgi:succinate dehydrogenase / fumarate reductase cytochrome b subunit
VASGARAYESAASVLASPLGILALMLWTFAFFYHCLAGVRHLMFDVGLGFERAQRRLSGLITISGAVVLTLAVWILLWHGAHS